MKHLYMFRSWLGWLNFFILQWFFIRLELTVLIPDESRRKIISWDILHWVVPLTGWWTDYRWVKVPYV